MFLTSTVNLLGLLMLICYNIKNLQSSPFLPLCNLCDVIHCLSFGAVSFLIEDLLIHVFKEKI